MFEVVRTPAASRDITGVAATIAERDPEAAFRFIDDLDELAARLSRFPESGESVDAIRPGMRRALSPPYVVYYRVLGQIVEIDRVVHGARDVGNIFP